MRTVKIYQEGYIDEEEFHGAIAAVELALRRLEVPEVDGVTYDEVVEAGEHLPGMTALWDVATPEERRDMVTLILQPAGLYYDTELKMIAALKPQSAFLPVLRMLAGVVEYEETSGLLVTEHWSLRNRRASNSLSPVLIHFVAPHGKLLQRLLALEQLLGSLPPIVSAQQHPGPLESHHGIPAEEWPNVVRRFREQHESLRQIAAEYGVSHETIRRVLRISDKERAG